MAGGLPLDERLARIAAGAEACRGIEGELWRAGSAELEQVMGAVDAMVVAGESARVVVTAEAIGRGETGSGPRALTPVAWVRRHAPSTVAGGAGVVVSVAQAFAVAGNAPVKDAVLSGVLPVRSAAVVVSEAEKLLPLVVEAARPTVLDGLIRIAAAGGPRECRKLRPEMLAKYGVDGQLQREQDAAKRFVALSQPFVDEMGVAEYRLTLDPEGKAMLEAALGPLSAPQPVEGERDLRSSDRRRGDALVTLVRRAVESAELTPKGVKSQLFVTVDLETLRSGVSGAGEVLAGTQAGELLAPETMRRLACDAMIIPTVMGVEGAVVDLGRQERLVHPAAGAPAVASRPALHVSGVHDARAVGRCASPDSLGRWRPLRSVERSFVVRTTPHGGAHAPVRRAAGRGRRRLAGGVGPKGRLVRRSARRARRAPTSVTPPRTPPQAAGSQPWALGSRGRPRPRVGTRPLRPGAAGVGDGG